jgi:hypothetical protein
VSIEYVAQLTLFVAFTILGSISATLNFLSALQASGWLRFPDFNRNRSLVVKGSLVTSAVYLLAQIIFLAVAGVALANPPKNPVPASSTGHFIGWAIVAAQALLSYAAVTAYVIRTKLLRSIDQEEAEHHETST